MAQRGYSSWPPQAYAQQGQATGYAQQPAAVAPPPPPPPAPQPAAAAQQQQQLQALQAQHAQQLAHQRQQQGQLPAVPTAPGAAGGRPQPRPAYAALPTPYASLPTPAPAPPPAPVNQGGNFVVFTKGNDADEVVVRTLIGEYVEKGSNHGRKVYQKVSDKAGPDFVDVFLYYWDHRDGPSFEGWWFGNKLGGTQVWSHCASSDLMPPGSGWKIPWDGAVRATLFVMPKAEQQKQQAEEKGRLFSAEVARLDSQARAAVEQAKATAGDYTTPASLLQAEQLLAPHAAPVAELQRKVAEEQQRAGSGEAGRVFAQLAAQVNTIQGLVSTELSKLQTTRQQVEQDGKAREAELKDGKLFQEIMPEATEKANTAEDAVEKASITSEMIAAGGDNIEEVQRAVSETEAAVKAAQSSIGEARIYLNAKQAAVKRFESDKVRAMAATELAKLQQQLQEAQNKLNPLKTVRQDFMQRQAARKIVDEILEMLTPAELDCDRAEEAGNVLGGSGLSKESLQQADQALKRASEQIANCSRMVAHRKEKEKASTIILGEIETCEDRIKTTEERLVKLRTANKEAAERLTCEALLKEATEKLQAVQEAVARAADAEGPFLMGVEELPLEESMNTLKACEAAAVDGRTQASICRMSIATKLVEARRFSAKLSQEAQGKLRDLQKQLESTYVRKLGDMKKATQERKAKALQRGSETFVAEAETLTKRVGEAAAIFDDDRKLCEASAEDLKVAAEETQKAEQMAMASIVEARKFISQRQIESKGRDATVEVCALLLKFQTRVTSAQSEVARWKKLASSCEQRLAAKRVLVEAKDKVVSAEESVKQVTQMVAVLDGDTSGGDEAVKAAETAASECQVTLKAVAGFLQAQSRAQNAFKDDLAKLQTRLKEIQEQLEQPLAAMRSRAEQQQVKGMVAESEAKVKEAEGSVKKAADAECPFLLDGELPLEQATSALAELDSAFQAAHGLVGSSKTFIAMKKLAARRLSGTSSTSCAEELAALQARLESSSKKLADIKKGMTDRRNGMVKREVSSKIVEVQQLLEAAKEATKQLVEGCRSAQEETDGVKEAHEKAVSAQTQAQVALAGARKLAVQRQQEVKASSNDPATLTEITKMVDQFNRLQKELDAQKGLSRDQEHRFAAARLLSEVQAQVESLEKKMEALTQLAAPLVSDQKEDLMASIWLEQIVDALKKNMDSISMDKEALFKMMGGEDSKLSEAKFVKFVAEFPELCEEQDSIFKPEELKASFKKAGGEPGGSLSLEKFGQLFLRKYVVTVGVAMTDSFLVKGSKTIRKVEENEIVEALKEPQTEGTNGLTRVYAKAEKDGKDGFVTISGNQGTTFLEPYSPYAALEKRAESSLQEMAEAITAASKSLEQKMTELTNGRQTGPLVEAKGDLAKLKPRVTKVQFLHSTMKKKVTEAQKKLGASMEAEKKRRQEAGERRSAKAMMDENTTRVSSLEAQVSRCVPVAEALVKSRGADCENPLAAVEAAERDVQATVDAIEIGQTALGKQLDEIRVHTRGPFTEARGVLVKLKVHLSTFKSRCQKQVTALKAVRKQLGGDAPAASG